jgi:D-proline reductase (dithiol) PrdB
MLGTIVPAQDGAAVSDISNPPAFPEWKMLYSSGSRTDLTFKFLAKLSNEDAAACLQGLLWKLGESFDDGEFGRLVDHVYEWQVRAYSGDVEWAYDEGPFTPLRKPVSQSRLALVTSSGHFVEGDDPAPFGVNDMTQEEAAKRIIEFCRATPTLSMIPSDTPQQKLRVRHGGYDVRAARTDHNVVFPLEILLELEREGAIGELASKAYSFVGACSQIRLLKQTGPQWVRLLQQEQPDAVLLVPA